MHVACTSICMLSMGQATSLNLAAALVLLAGHCRRCLGANWRRSDRAICGGRWCQVSLSCPAAWPACTAGSARACLDSAQMLLKAASRGQPACATMCKLCLSRDNRAQAAHLLALDVCTPQVPGSSQLTRLQPAGWRAQKRTQQSRSCQTPALTCQTQACSWEMPLCSLSGEHRQSLQHAVVAYCVCCTDAGSQSAGAGGLVLRSAVHLHAVLALCCKRATHAAQQGNLHAAEARSPAETARALQQRG